MKTTKFLALSAVAALALIGGCNKSTKSDMGAMDSKAKCSEKGGSCCDAKKEGAMGTMNTTKATCTDKAACTNKQ